MIICPACDSMDLGFAATDISCRSCGAGYKITDDIPCFFSSGPSHVDGFSDDLFDYLYSMEKKHFWFWGRNRIIRNLLKASVTEKLENLSFMEIGCGNGFVMSYLRDAGLKVSGGDIFFKALKFCQARGNTDLFQLDAAHLPFKNEFDLIGLFDCLEHIADDVAVLGSVYKALKPGGKIILTVPANQALWSSFDETSHHQRRYSKDELLAKLSGSGFIPERAGFFNFILFPFIWLMRRRDKPLEKPKTDLDGYVETKTIPVVNSLFKLAMGLESILIPYIPFPAGSSLIAVAKKAS